jgi:hypothetical protein
LRDETYQQVKILDEKILSENKGRVANVIELQAKDEQLLSMIKELVAFNNDDVAKAF